MRSTALLAALCTIAFAACSDDGGGDTKSGDIKTLNLQARDDGSLAYCDDAGNCTSLPNPDGCATLTVNIDTASGKTCQVCTAADGTRGPENCGSPAVACAIVTIPDPDCVVCAYVNGTVIFSSCEPSPPICYTTNYDGSMSGSGDAGPGYAYPNTEASPPVDNAGTAIAPPPGCTICVDANGKRISQDCPPSCLDVMCPMVECAEGYRFVTGPGECCGHCEPIVDCKDMLCAAMVPYCPDGQLLVKDPNDCCGWYCEPQGCDERFMCPLMPVTPCEEGYHMSYESPNCCGACVPDSCNSDADCAPEEYCATPMCPCLSTSPAGACELDPSCYARCIPDGMAF